MPKDQPPSPYEEDLERDRRDQPRAPLSLLVQHRVEDVDTFMEEYSQDISVGGMFLRTDTPHAVGSTIYLQFKLEDGSPLIEGMGRVVHVNPPGGPAPEGMGIEFVSFDEASLAFIEEIVASRLVGAEA